MQTHANTSSRAGAVHADREYHAVYFKTHRVGEVGSWLAQPDEFLIRHMGRISTTGVVVDLGCGPGRLAIPILSHMQGCAGRIICLDYVEEALNSLMANTRQIDHANQLIPLQVDLAHFALVPDSVDTVVAWSVWEATFSPQEIRAKLEEVRDAVRASGCVFIMFNTDMRCTVNGRADVSAIEQKRGNMRSADARSLLLSIFSSWNIIEIEEKDDAEVIESDGRRMEWTSTHLMFAALKS